MKREKLFAEFSPNTTKQWEEKIKEDLKGASYEKKLIWNTNEGFKISPYYRDEDLKNINYLDALPGEFPYSRGNMKKTRAWEIRQDIPLDDIRTANQKALFILDRGVTSLGFITNPDKRKSPLRSQEDFSQLMKDILFDRIGVHFICCNKAPEILEYLCKEVELRKAEPSRVSGSVDFDPLGYLTTSGNYYNNEDSDFQALRNLIRLAKEKLSNYKVLGINGYFFNHAGATVVQELGYSMAMASDYLTRLINTGIDLDTVCHHIQFNFGIGPSYFMEIAKIRASRFLWAQIVEAYQPGIEKSKQAYIHSITSRWNQTIYDPYVNVLRATTESMAAILGGTDSLVVRPFTCAYSPTTSFSGRLARNIQIILGEEAYLGKVIDPSAGSYYIENLTNSIIEKAWKIFLRVEEEGGYLEAIKKGIIQSDIKTTAENRSEAIAMRKEISLGTNQYPNFNESVVKEVVHDIAFPPVKPEKFKVMPIRQYRGSMDFERLRLAVENHPEGKPKVFILTYGDHIMRRARATFACNFFAGAGYEIIDNQGFATAEEGVKSALAVKASIVVLCSSDEEYSKLGPAVYALLKNKAILVVAGAPECMQELKSQGVENFIHLRSNMIETLIRYHKKLGINM